MRLIATKPRYHCDFCSHTSTEVAMRRHEKICYRNPNRFCELCENRGVTTEYYDFGMSEDIPCYYCKQINPDLLAALEASSNGTSPVLDKAPDANNSRKTQ